MAEITQSIPHLCVVGHPNRGKSSIVAALTENDSVRIGPESGTTTRADTFEFVIDQRVVLQLTDTPGFQRARQVLAWLQQQPVSPAERPARVQQFLQEPEHAQRFPDEVALLTPIMAGAGILYVVDGAQSVTPADEAEMEILRWTGQPRMAVINPMGEVTGHDDFIQQWQTTLEQFFQWVRSFNPLTANLATRYTLLRAMGELHQRWSGAMRELCQRLEARDRQRLEDVSYGIAQYWCTQMMRREPVTLLEKTGLTTAETALRRELDRHEELFFQQLSRTWGHATSALERESEWELGQDNLMNTETWYLWGLKQRDLLLVSGAAGTATGLLVDVGTGGSSLLLGAVSGGVIGSVGGWLAARQLPGKRLGWLPLTREKQFAGPVQHPNFPLVVMARALTVTRQLWQRSHAERGTIILRTSASDWSRQEQVQLLQWTKAVQQNQWKTTQQDRLVAWIKDQLRSANTNHD
jgi:GTPase SAR1 family protein